MNKNIIISACILIVLSLAVKAQGNLQFNQVKIITNTLETVPAGKVWKVEGIYGQEFRLNECIDYFSGSTHEIGVRMRCAVNSDESVRFSYFISSFELNGKPFVSKLSGFSDQTYTMRYTTNNCTGSYTYSSSTVQWSCANQLPDETIFPLWLPAGTTLKTGGANTYLTVIEFNVIP